MTAGEDSIGGDSSSSSSSDGMGGGGLGTPSEGSDSSSVSGSGGGAVEEGEGEPASLASLVESSFVMAAAGNSYHEGLKAFIGVIKEAYERGYTVPALTMEVSFVTNRVRKGGSEGACCINASDGRWGIAWSVRGVKYFSWTRLEYCRVCSPASLIDRGWAGRGGARGGGGSK